MYVLIHFLGKLFKESHKSQYALLPFCSLFSKTEVITDHSLHVLRSGLPSGTQLHQGYSEFTNT